MPGWIKAALWIIGIWAVCYALNIDPLAVPAHIIQSLKEAHQASVTGR